ncbi:MAG: hypothetical protein ACFFBP_04160 [Promethearchaeota archaeon]
MSVPSSLRVGPFNALVLAKKRYILFYLFLMWISILSVFFEFWIFWQEINTWHFIFPWRFDIHFYLLIPLIAFLMYLTVVLVSLFFAKLLLVIINAIHKPREGVFLRDVSDKDYRYWSMRNTIKRWPVWLAHRFPFPFLDNLCFKVFGVKTKFNNSLFEGWVDCEFIDFGNNVVVGQGSTVQSSILVGNLLIIKKTTIDDNARIGTHSFVMPGTHMGKNTVLTAASTTTIGQELEDGWIYAGLPAVKFKKNKFFEDNLQEIIGGQIKDIDALQEKYQDIYTRRHDDQLKLTINEGNLGQKEKLENK